MYLVASLKHQNQRKPDFLSLMVSRSVHKLFLEIRNEGGFQILSGTPPNEQRLSFMSQTKYILNENLMQDDDFFIDILKRLSFSFVRWIWWLRNIFSLFYGLALNWPINLHSCWVFCLAGFMILLWRHFWEMWISKVFLILCFDDVLYGHGFLDI